MKEVDFAGEKAGSKRYIQVCCLLHDESAIAREFGSMLEIQGNYHQMALFQEGAFRGNYEGIPAAGMEDWLTGTC
ncbi:MAG: hypothetical protein HFG14_11200 [Lachnospiraceae bacterium]|jgi:hypothetical protein|nr:hypothetical protein [Lachnospiraceae bacterium]